jgi:hypothetical protein
MLALRFLDRVAYAANGDQQWTLLDWKLQSFLAPVSSLPESGSLPSAKWFAECFFRTLGKELPSVFLILGKELLC